MNHDDALLAEQAFAVEEHGPAGVSGRPVGGDPGGGQVGGPRVWPRHAAGVRWGQREAP